MNPTRENGHRANGTRFINKITSDVSTTVNTTDIAPVLQLRRQAAMLCVPAECGCVDPWTCRCKQKKVTVTDHELDGWRDTIAMLLDKGMTPLLDVEILRALWRRGGIDRRLAQAVADRAGVAA